MIKTLSVFKEFKLEDIGYRQELFAVSGREFTSENILYAICCHDYFYKPDDDKLTGLKTLFIENNAPCEINVSYKNRKSALKLLDSPQIKVKPAHLSHPGNTKRHHFYKFSFFRRRSGAASGGVANWNLMTQGIELTLPECMGKIKTSLMVKFLDGELTEIPPLTPQCVKQVRLVAQYWGARVIQMGIT